MPTADEHIIQGGQRAIATSNQDGTVLYDGGPTDIHCIVNVNGKAQRAIKTADLNSGTFSKDVVFRKKEMPTASEATHEMVVLYAGTTNADYTHGYIYECVADATYQTLIGFEPTKIAFDYTKGNLQTFFSEYTQDFAELDNGEFTYIAGGDIWSFNGKDSQGNILFEDIRLYTQDLKDAGFVFINPSEEYSDGDVIEYYMSQKTVYYNYRWQRIDVQP